MLDPFRIPAPEPVQDLLVRIAGAFRLWALPLHAHEVLFALSLYAFIAQVVSPLVSARLLPNTYNRLNSSSKINWNVHVVSFVQSCIVNALSFYVIFYDAERKSWRPDDKWDMRIFGYTGLTGLLQSFALGYFLFDLYMCARYVDIFGKGMVVHAIASTAMFTFGFRPFIHFYCPVFLLHELSTPFLQVHWFCDKLGLTGSIYQAINGAFLTATFFCCRILWGAYGAMMVSKDVYRATFTGQPSAVHFEDTVAGFPNLDRLSGPRSQTTSFMKVQRLPLWLGLTYLTANVSLTILNTYWFSQMVKTIRRRFDPPFGTKEMDKSDKVYARKKQ